MHALRDSQYELLAERHSFSDIPPAANFVIVVATRVTSYSGILFETLIRFETSTQPIQNLSRSESSKGQLYISITLIRPI